MINVIIGYLIVINIISMIFMYIDMKEKYLKLEKSTINFIYLSLAILGGFIGILVTSQMYGYKKDNKLIKKIIPFIIFIEVLIIVSIYLKVNNINLY